jgi:hypothetical protein
MARPKCWFAPKAYNTARKAAKEREHALWKYTRNLRGGGTESGYYVGAQLPIRLANAEVEERAA